MKKRLATLLLALALFAAVLPMGTTFAQSPAYETPFTTSVTYQNVSDNEATISVLFYTPSGEQISVSQDPLPAGAGASLFVGNVGDELPAGFEGSAILQSDQPVVATMVQVPASDTVKNRPLSNGFAQDQTATTYLIPTVLKGVFSTNTTFSVQNAEESSDVMVDVTFTPVSGATIQVNDISIPVGAAHYFDVGMMSEVPAGFNGSATVSADGMVVAAALEASTTSTSVHSFEGVTEGAAVVYMPTALCNAFNASTSYAVQNTGASSSDVTVTYSNGTSQMKTIAANAKQSFAACDVVSAGFSGSATVTSNNNALLVAIGKAFGGGLSTSFLGEPVGYDTLALPYVRYADDTTYFNGTRQRTNIAIQNVGSTTLAAGSVSVEYRDLNGTLVGTHTNPDPITAGAKWNSNAAALGAAGTNFGYIGGFGGGAIVRGPSGSELATIARVTSKVTAVGVEANVGEDYNGIPIE